MRRIVLCAVLATALSAPCAQAQNERPIREVWALTNARIVVAPGRVIERGTVVVRDGRIAAVGANVAVPADAYPLDASGLSVYPGLIDAATGIGLPRIGAQGGGGSGGGGQAAQSDGSELRPTRLSSDDFTARDADLEALRAAGFTTLGLAFEGGILPGRAAAVSTGSTASGERVLRAPVAQQAAFGTARGVYPATLMGTLAHLRQSFHDAAHMRAASAAFARDPGSLRRPLETDDMRAVAAAGARELPVWIAASRENDLRRALDLGNELNLDFRIIGAQEGYRMTGDLARHGHPVMVSLDFPRPAQVTGRAFEMRVAPLGGGESGSADADSAVMRQVRGNAASLVAAGVPVALVSHGISRPAEFSERIREAISAGLPAEEALRALTITPARLLGLERAVGTVEVGRLANLVVVEGELFSRDGRIRHVFVEGRHYEPRAPARARGDAVPPSGPLRPDAPRPPEPARIAGVANAEGSWAALATAQGQTLAFTLTIRQQGSRLSAELSSDAGTSTLVGEATETGIVLRGQVLFSPDVPPTDVVVSATVDGDRMSGVADAAGIGSTDFNATRTPGGSR
jgi:imidazolonepropionase-like amidohydrolase